MRTIISFGSNMGQKRQYIEDALKMMGEKAGKILAVSSVIETEPYGYTDQDVFLNGAALKVPDGVDTGAHNWHQ